MHRSCNPPKQCMHGLSSPELEASISPFAATCSCQDLAQTFWKNYEAHNQSKCSGSSWFFIVLSPSKGRACTPCTLKNRTLWCANTHLFDHHKPKRKNMLSLQWCDYCSIICMFWAQTINLFTVPGKQWNDGAITLLYVSGWNTSLIAGKWVVYVGACVFLHWCYVTLKDGLFHGICELCMDCFCHDNEFPEIKMQRRAAMAR